ncbi:hypothetical protein Lal_00018250 [Lupinus albus]|nr:hypothetical protein Lal_00018250 [Lupinus albus]
MGLKPHDRPYIISKVFKMKFEELLHDLKKRHICTQLNFKKEGYRMHTCLYFCICLINTQLLMTLTKLFSREFGSRLRIGEGISTPFARYKTVRLIDDESTLIAYPLLTLINSRSSTSDRDRFSARSEKKDAIRVRNFMNKRSSTSDRNRFLARSNR